jgi:hypothetical protein
MHGRHRRRWLAQSQAFDQLPQLKGHAPRSATIRTRSMRQANQATPLIALQPALGGAQRDTPIARQPLQWHTLFQNRPQPVELIQGASSIGFAEGVQRCPLVGLTHTHQVYVA